jgi:hypothetical protein
MFKFYTTVVGRVNWRPLPSKMPAAVKAFIK